VFCFPNKKQEYSVLLSGDRPLGAGLLTVQFVKIVRDYFRIR
jgi:hypothetical protein